MINRHLGEDVRPSFRVRIRKQPIIPIHCSGEVYKGEKYIGPFPTVISGNKVSGLIGAVSIKSIGDYIAKFIVITEEQGKLEHAIPFRITKSVLGKKRV